MMMLNNNRSESYIRNETRDNTLQQTNGSHILLESVCIREFLEATTGSTNLRYYSRRRKRRRRRRKFP
jgi:hypothetical protein